jgi:hypothetical protein
MDPTKKAYLSHFPFVTHVPSPNYLTPTDPVFNPYYNEWHWFTTPTTPHPINSLDPVINPFRNLFAELIITGQVSWDGNNYTFGLPQGFWHTCKRYNINPKFPPTPIFTAPTGNPNYFKAIGEYYKLFGTYNQITNTNPWIPYLRPKPLRPLSTTFQFPLSAKLVPYAKRRHCPECSDTSSSEESKDFPPLKRIKKEETDT